MQYSEEDRRMQELDEQIRQYEQIVLAVMKQFDWPMTLAKAVVLSGLYIDSKDRKFALFQDKDKNGVFYWALKPIEMRVE